MRISLLRHGAPRIDTPRRLDAHEFARWVEAYDAAEIIDQRPPPGTLHGLSHSCAIVCSDLPRSLSSARALRLTPLLQSELFRECPLPAPPRLPLRLSASGWLLAMRLPWWCGYSGEVESARQSRLRSEHAANELERLANEHGEVLLIGHGMFNHFLAGELRKRGWLGSRLGPAGHWSRRDFLPSRNKAGASGR